MKRALEFLERVRHRFDFTTTKRNSCRSIRDIGKRSGKKNVGKQRKGERKRERKREREREREREMEMEVKTIP